MKCRVCKKEIRPGQKLVPLVTATDSTRYELMIPTQADSYIHFDHLMDLLSA